MALIRKITLVVSIVFCGSLALAAAAIAAGGGGGLGPGDYVFSNTTAAAQFGIPNPLNQNPGFDVFVNKGLNSFQLENPEDSPPVVSNSTIVNLQIFGTKGQGFFCFVLSNPSDFSISKDLKSASLHTTLTAAEMCNQGGPVTGKGAPAPLAGGGGPALLPPFRVDVTWTGTGVYGSGRDRNSFNCGNYSTQATTDTKTAGEKATGTLDVLGGSFNATSAGIIDNTTHMEVKGAPVQGCFGF
jgi:hypothetical protein